MKTAVLLSGQPRSFEKYVNTIKNNIIIPNDADVFIHTLDNKSRDLETKLVNNYKPIRYIIEDQVDFQDLQIDFTHTLNSGYGGGAEHKKVAQYYTFAAQSMWYSLKRGFSLIPKKYDCVIKVRFDLGLHRAINCSQYNMGMLWAEHLGRPELVNNWMNFSSWDTMKEYCSIYDYLLDYYKETKIWCNEYWIKKTMDKIGVSIGYDGWGLTIENTDVRKFL